MFVQQMHLYSTLVEDLTKEVSECGEDSLTSSVGTAAASMGTSLAGNKGSVVINFLEGRFIHQTQIQCFMRYSMHSQTLGYAKTFLELLVQSCNTGPIYGIRRQLLSALQFPKKLAISCHR